MNEHLRDRILRKLETLSDERGYQLLDYVEFLESRYAERQAPASTVFTRFTEVVEDRLRAGRVSATTITEAVGLMNRAAGILNNAMAAGKSMANELVNVPPRPGPGSGSTGATTTTPAASNAAGQTPPRGSGEEKL